MRILIYIPLCLYFNYIGDCSYEARYIFTFHYVSILMERVAQIADEIKKFTFHYVSILIHPPHLFLFSFFSTHFLSTYQ